MLSRVELSRKLQIKDGQSVAVMNPPDGFELGLPAAAAGDADAVIGFATRQSDLDDLEPVFQAAREDRLAWIGYPKAGQLGTDLNRDRLAEAVSVHAVQPVRQVAIDSVWSALRFRPA